MPGRQSAPARAGRGTAGPVAAQMPARVGAELLVPCQPRDPVGGALGRAAVGSRGSPGGRRPTAMASGARSPDGVPVRWLRLRLAWRAPLQPRGRGLDSRRLTVIPNGIDPGPFDRASAVPRGDLGIPEQAHLALAVGRLDVQKGLADLLAAAEKVIAQCPSWHLALAGDGPCRAWLLEQVDTQPLLGGRIHWLGPR